MTPAPSSSVTLLRMTYIVKEDLHDIQEFWGQMLFVIPAPPQTKLEMVDTDVNVSVSLIVQV